MSLINDALKRAGQNTARPAAPPPPVPVAMCPVEKITSRGLPKFFLPLALVIFCAALAILFRGISGQRPINAVARPPVVAARTPVPAPSQLATRVVPPASPATRAVAAPVRTTPTAAVSNTIRPQTASPRPATAPVAVAPSGPVAPRAASTVTLAPPVQRPVAATAPAPQTFKLGGIFYRASNPSAVINNRPVSVGERLGNARVKSIARDTVVLEFPGDQLLELTL